jgi:hypothetical protein
MRIFLSVIFSCILICQCPGQGIATDTLRSFFQTSGATLIHSPNGGYVSGTNGYGDSEKLQAFFPGRSYSVLGTFVWTGKKVFTSGDASSRVCLKVKNFDTTSINSYPFVKGIGSTLDSAWFSLADSTTAVSFEAGLKYYPFASPVLINSFYTVGISFDSLARDEAGNLLDSVAIFSSAMDSVSTPFMSWEKWNGNYKRIADTWGFDIDLAFFPVIDTTLNGVQEITNLDFDIFPNPTTNYFQIHAKLSVNSTVELIDIFGKIILKHNVDVNCDKLIIDLNSIRSGYYLVKITCPNQIGVKPLLVK